MPEQVQVRKRIDWLKVSQLLLDDHNFRFPEDARGANQQELLRILDRDFELLPIGESLADNGYFVEEPLVAIPKAANEYIVVEGNRRLAALKLLLEKDLRPFARDPSAWEDLANRAKEDLSEVPVVIYQSRDELTTVLGYRHIAGILKWNPLAKARFINNLVEKKGKEADFTEIAQETGSHSDTIMNQYTAYRTYLQARDVFRIDTSKLEKKFSVFYRAISGTRPIAQFIGLSTDKSAQELRSPIAPEKASALDELIGYIHGTGTAKPVIRDSRQLTQLGEVLASKPALENLRQTRSLERAHELVGGKAYPLLNNLSLASYYLEEALREARRHKGDPKVKALVIRCARAMSQIAKHYPEAQRELEGTR